MAAPAKKHAPAGGASRYALGADGVGAARPAPAASLISARATRSRRTALRARGRAARLCVPRGAQPLAAIAALRYALGADGVGAARLGACGSQVAASRYALGAEGMGAARPGAYMLSPPPITCARCLLVVGMSKTSLRFALLETLGARRCFALLPRARVGRGGPDIIMRERAGERSCAAAACAVRVGAERHWDRSAFSPGQADPPRFQRACCSASRSSRADASALRAGGRPRKGVRRIIDPKGLGSQRARSSAGYDPRIHMYMSLRAEKSSCIPGIRGYLA